MELRLDASDQVTEMISY